MHLGLKTLKQSGVTDSYQYLLTSLCKYGLPTGDLYEFSALTILRYEKKLKLQRKKELEERLKQRKDQKMPLFMKNKAGVTSPEMSPERKGVKKVVKKGESEAPAAIDVKPVVKDNEETKAEEVGVVEGD